MDPAELEQVYAKLREQYPEDIVQEMLVKLWRAKGTVKNPVAYAKSCWRTIQAERFRALQGRSLVPHEVAEGFDLNRLAHEGENPLARAEAIQAIERCPEDLLADALGIRPLTKIQRHRARKRGR